MSLAVWLPLNGDLHNQGLKNITITNNGATTNNNGKIGQCYSFNGSSNYLFGSASGLNNSTTEYSYACWLKLNNTSHTGCLFSNRTAVSPTGFTIFYASGQFYFDDGDRWNFTPASALVTNTWYHICFTWKKNVGIKYYCNGVLKNQTTTTHTPTTVSTQFTIGKSQDTATTVSSSGGNPLNGYLNDVRVYDHCLSPKEVEEIAKGLVLHYKLDGETQIMVPSGYQQLEYLESSGENQYIDTGLVPTTNFQYNFKYSIITFNGYRGAFGAYSAEADNTTRIISINGSTANIYMYFNSKASSPNIRINNLTTATNQIIEGYFLKTEYWLKNLTTGSIFTQSSPTDLFPTKGNTLTATMKLFRYNINADNSGCNSRIYYFDTYNNGSCIQKLIPAKRLSDNVLGMYDIITSTFFTNAGTGTFTAGPNASITGTIYDSSGYSNNGTIVGTLTAAAPSPRYGTATQFNGTSSYIEAEPLPSETVTISTWVKFKTLPGSYKIILHDKSTGLAIGLTSTYRLITYVGNSNGGVGSQAQLPTLSTDTWYHIVVIKTGNTTRDVYFNGEQITNLSKNYWGGDLDKFTVGARYISGAYNSFFDGQISDVRAYTTALNSTQIKELYTTSMSIDSSGNIHARELVEL